MKASNEMKGTLDFPVHAGWQRDVTNNSEQLVFPRQVVHQFRKPRAHKWLPTGNLDHCGRQLFKRIQLGIAPLVFPMSA